MTTSPTGYGFTVVPKDSMDYLDLHRELPARHVLLALTPPGTVRAVRTEKLRELIYQTIARCHYSLVLHFAAKKGLTKQHRSRSRGLDDDPAFAELPTTANAERRHKQRLDKRRFESELSEAQVLGENLAIAYDAALCLSQGRKLQLGGDAYRLSRGLLTTAILSAATALARSVFGRKKDRRFRSAIDGPGDETDFDVDITNRLDEMVGNRSSPRATYLDLTEVATPATGLSPEDLWIMLYDLLEKHLGLPVVQGTISTNPEPWLEPQRTAILAQLDAAVVGTNMSVDDNRPNVVWSNEVTD